MAGEAAMTVKLSGPLFQNPRPAVQAAIKRGMLQAALLGQRLVQEQLTPGHGVKTGTFRRSVVGTAGEWHTGIVTSPLVYAGPLERGHGRFGGYHMFENAQKKLDQAGLDTIFGEAVAKALGGGE